MRIYLSILFIFFSLFSLAQKSGFIKIEQEKYKEAEEIFEFVLQNKKENSPAFYGLSLLCSDKKTRFFNPEKALAYADSSVLFYKKLSSEEKEEFKNILDETILKQNYENIEIQVFNSAKAEGENAVKIFAEHYPESRFSAEAKKILQLYEKLREVESKNLVEVYNDFIAKHPNFPGQKYAVAKRNKKAFAEAKLQNSAKAYTDFINNYPEAKEIEQAYAERLKCDSIELLIPTFRGNAKRNFYGKKAPDALNLKWKFHLGSGQSRVKEHYKIWSGAGWTGQPILVKEKEKTYLLQGAYDYNLRKINAKNGKEIWAYKFDDIIKGTGTIWINRKADKKEERYIILQGSRYGQNLDKETAEVVPSFRAVSLISGKELWRMNSGKTMSYSRDVDASALVINDTAYIGLENGLFTVFNPNPAFAEDTLGIFQPDIYSQTWLYRKRDYVENSSNLVIESSPTLLNNKIYQTTGSGHVYGYNLKTNKIDWDYYIGADLDGTAVVSHDKKLYITLECEFIKGKGGVLKINPDRPEENCVEWFFPTANRRFGEWEGGIVGSVATNSMANTEEKYPEMLAFIGIDGYLYVVHSTETVPEKLVESPNLDKMHKTPKLIFKYKVNPSIASPIFVDNKLIVPSSTGLYLFEYNTNAEFKLTAKRTGHNFEASPIVWNGNIYIASRDGYLYCLGN